MNTNNTLALGERYSPALPLAGNPRPDYSLGCGFKN